MITIFQNLKASNSIIC